MVFFLGGGVQKLKFAKMLCTDLASGFGKLCNSSSYLMFKTSVSIYISKSDDIFLLYLIRSKPKPQCFDL